LFSFGGWMIEKRKRLLSPTGLAALPGPYSQDCDFNRSGVQS